jgi:hypothetical protein
MRGVDSQGGATPMPLVREAFPESAHVPHEELLEWSCDEREWLDNRLKRHGTLLFRGFKCLRQTEDIQAEMEVMSEQLLDYSGGNTPRSAVQCRIVTSTDAPAHLTIGVHREMSYLERSFADRSEISVEDLNAMRRVRDETMVMFDWQVGDLMICDDKLVSHGRRPHEPPRKILAAMDSDRPIG